MNQGESITAHLMTSGDPAFSGWRDDGLWSFHLETQILPPKSECFLKWSVSPDIISPGKHMAYGCPVWGLEKLPFSEGNTQGYPDGKPQIVAPWNQDCQQICQSCHPGGHFSNQNCRGEATENCENYTNPMDFQGANSASLWANFHGTSMWIEAQAWRQWRPHWLPHAPKMEKNGRKKTPLQHPDNDTGRNAWTANTWPSEIPIRTTIRYQSPTTISGGLATVYLLWIATSSTLLLSYSR